MDFIYWFILLNQTKGEINIFLSVKLSNTLKNINLLENEVNSELIFPLYNYLQPNDTYKICNNENFKSNLIYNLFLYLY
jgi:hypothetical protein